MIDSITAFFAFVAILPWLQPIIKTVEMLGMKLELQELKGQVAEARGAAESASQQATFALVSSLPMVSSPNKATESVTFAATLDALLSLTARGESL